MTHHYKPLLNMKHQAPRLATAKENVLCSEDNCYKYLLLMLYFVRMRNKKNIEFKRY